MQSLLERLGQVGIRLKSYQPRTYKVLYPECSHTRKAKKDPCLAVTVGHDDHAVWPCHHCDWFIEGVSREAPYGSISRRGRSLRFKTARMVHTMCMLHRHV